MKTLVMVLLVLGLAVSAYGLEKKALQMREDYGTEPLYNCTLSYEYYIPCPTYSWFWSFSGWPVGQVVGEWFRVGDPTMSRTATCPPAPVFCDPRNAGTLEQIRVLDFAGYGTIYPGLFTVEFDLWCSDSYGCPVGPALWSSGPTELCVGGWNYIRVVPQPCLIVCYSELFGGMQAYPRILVTARHIGSNGAYPAWGFDNVSSPLSRGCVMHDNDCCPALYPRPTNSYYGRMHSGDYGVDFANCPPYWVLDPGDSVGDVYGCIELPWRLYLINSGPTATEPSTWGQIKAIYK